MKITNDSTANGCISNILRHILPRNFARSKFSASKHFTTEETMQEDMIPPPSPCLVARLMGLETMPSYDPYGTPKKMIARSRSTNSMDNWNGYLCSKMNGSAKHNASQSFREEPTFIRKENDEFLVLNFAPIEELQEKKYDNGENIVGTESVLHDIKNIKPMQLEERCKRHEESKRKSANGVMKQRNESRSLNLTNHKQDFDTELAECNSRESSPVSVLDPFLDIDIQISPVSEEHKKPNPEKPRKGLSSKKKRESYSFLKSEINKNSKEELMKTNTITDCNKIKRRRLVLSDMWTEICLLTEQEVKNLNLKFTDIFHCSEHNKEIAVVLSEQILDFLLSELIKELLIL